jgi:hypothetical protein
VRLGLRCEIIHAGAAQRPQLLDEQCLHLIGGLQGTIGIACELQDALEARPQLGMPAEPLEKLFFCRVELVAACSFMLHPDPNATSGDICTFYSAEIFLTHF